MLSSFGAILLGNRGRPRHRLNLITNPMNALTINVQPAAGVDLEHSHHVAHVPRVVSRVYVRRPPAMRGTSVAPRVSSILVIIMNTAPTRPGRLHWQPSEPEFKFMPRPGPSAARACRDSDLPVDHVQVHAGGGRGFSAPLARRWGHQPQLSYYKPRSPLPT